MTDLQFSWELSGSGWATCRIADGPSERKDIVSYCTDALADVLHGVAGLYGPNPVHRFSFDLEPAEVRWVLRSMGSDVRISIYRFPACQRASTRTTTTARSYGPRRKTGAP